MRETLTEGLLEEKRERGACVRGGASAKKGEEGAFERARSGFTKPSKSL